MPEFGPDLRAALAKLALPLVLPAPYEQLTPVQRRTVREEYARRQGNRCYYCHADLGGQPPPEVLALKLDVFRFTPNFLDHPLHLHHDHHTGLTLGTVHAHCNGVLWQYHGE